MRPGFRTILFLLIFVLPLVAITIYELRYATDRYHSSAKILITQDTGTTQSFDLSVLGLPTAASSKDALTLVTFINSIDMMKYLDARLQLRQHYTSSDIDWYTRFPSEGSEEDFHEYLGDFVMVNYEIESQLISIEVQAFTREYAQNVVNAILERSQEFVDKLNARVTLEQTQFFERQLTTTEARVKDAKNALLRFQRENRLFSTDTEASMVTANIGSLEKLLLDKQGELTVRLKELNESSPAIQLLRTEIATIKQQLSQEKDRLSGGSGDAVSELDAQFREIQFNLEFVTNIYKSNMAQLEQARLQAVQRLKYLVVVTTPSLADASLYPDRPYIIGTAVIVLLMIFFVVSLLAAIIREHA
ncbi:MAG: hypothetical protein KDK89_19885 [Alphaproteobacteria bacterium]|nr:hypothetical protein [Alphaproteobacteria bacterium]